jgi:cell division protein FtsW (lipid II flippase)
MTALVGYRKRRGVELFMLVLAVGIGFAGYVLIHLNRDAKLPAAWPWALAALAGIGLVLHLVVRWRTPYADPLILPLVLLLNGTGLAMIHRLDLDDTRAPHSAELQLTWLFVAVAVCIAVLIVLRDYQVLRRYPYLLFLAGLVLLMLPLLPGIGQEKNGARIWIHLGNYSFQPAELAKIVLVIAFASYLVDKREVLALGGERFLGLDLPRARDLGPILVMWLVSLAVLIFQKDLGTSLLFFGLFVMMIYVATEKPSWAILGVLLFLVGAYGAYLSFGHVQSRVSAWLDPFSNYDRNYQVIQAQFGIAWGGIFGTGWGLGRPNLTPLPKSDFISAALGEELGVTGLMAIIAVYGLLVARGLRAALGARDPFGKLISTGLAFVFALQVFAIIGGVTRLLPLTGLTTPFLSQGGSSLVANWLLVALLLVITHQIRKPAPELPAQPMVSLAADTTQVIQVDRAASTPRPAPPVSPSEQISSISPDEPTEAIPATHAATPGRNSGTVPNSVQEPGEEPSGRSSEPSPTPSGPSDVTQAVPRIGEQP